MRFDCVEEYQFENGSCITKYRPRVWVNALNRMVEINTPGALKDIPIDAINYARNSGLASKEEQRQ